MDIGNGHYHVVVTVRVRRAAMVPSSSYQLWQLRSCPVLLVLSYCPLSVQSSSDDQGLAQVYAAGMPVTIL